MPVQKQKSALSSKLGEKGRQAHEAHKADETVLSGGGSDLPAGIDNGIAQVVDCKFGVYKEGDNKGEFFFFARAIVKEPEEVRGIPVRGLATQVGPEPICDTPKGGKRKTIDEHYAWALNELRKMGVKTDQVGFDDVEACAAAVKESKPHIRFRTWKGTKQELRQKNGQWFAFSIDDAGTEKQIEGPFKTEAAAKAKYPYAGREPRVQHDWRGPCEYNGSSGAENGVQDETGEVTTTTEDVAFGAEETATVESPTEQDLDSLVEAANGGDEAAQTQLQQSALDAGATQEDVDGAADWGAVAELCKAQTTEEAPAEEVPFKPAIREVYFYKPTVKGPGNKLVKAKKAVECEVKAVDEKTETVNLLNLDDKKTNYKGVKWTDLEQG